MSMKKEPGIVREGLPGSQLENSGISRQSTDKEHISQINVEISHESNLLTTAEPICRQPEKVMVIKPDSVGRLNTLIISRTQKIHHLHNNSLRKKGKSVVRRFWEGQVCESLNSHSSDSCSTQANLCLSSQALKNLQRKRSECNFSIDADPTESESHTGTSICLEDVSKDACDGDSRLQDQQQQQVKRYTCDFCSCSYNLLFEQCQHKLRHTKKRLFVCDLCQASYQHFLNLKTHLDSHAVDAELSSELCDHNSLHDFPKGGKFEQRFDQEKFVVFNRVRRNLTYDQKPRKRLRTKKIIHIYSCDYCDYTCSQSNDLQTHQKMHTEEKPYTCHFCNYTCRQSGQLKTHIRRHTGEKPYSCEFCDYAFARSCDLKVHIRRHTGEKPYSCDLCDYTCSVPDLLKVHKRRHVGEKPYACDLCEYTAIRTSDLSRHRLKHTGVKPYACDLCDFTSSGPYGLKVHRRRHTGEKPYSCDICEYATSRPCDLSRHRKKHSGERPYACDLCEFTSSLLYDLKRHKRIHTGEKPYSCDLCEYSCARSCDLKIHRKRHQYINDNV